MEIQSRVTNALYRSLDELNVLLPKSERIPKTTDAPLFGGGSSLDSVNLVNLIVSLENHLEQEAFQNVKLTEDPRFFQNAPAFKTVGSLIRFIVETLARGDQGK